MAQKVYMLDDSSMVVRKFRTTTADGETTYKDVE